jgi:outer membrane protein OmpA-like peptidoglycan-associated protein
MGGFDVFRSKYNPDTDTWGEPENLGYPINTSNDDLFYVISGDGEYAYYASIKDDSEGDNDIYRVSPPFAEVKEKESERENIDTALAEPIEPEEKVVEEGIEQEKFPVTVSISVYSNESKEAIPFIIEVVTERANETLVNEQAENPYEQSFSFEQEEKLMISVESEGFLFQTDRITVPLNNSDGEIIKKEFFLKRPEPFVINKLRNIYFAFDKHTLREQSYAELNKLYNLLEKNPTMKIEIAGHTDEIGPPEYNSDLSQQRANAVKKYLTSKGVSTDRVKAVGYGETKPMATNDDELEGRALNRRTEFIILNR